MRKHLNAETICQVAEMLAQVFTFADFTTDDMQAAAQLRWRDYEDAIQAVTAKRLGVDYIITRNVKDFTDSPVPFVTPEIFKLQILRPNDSSL